MTAQTSLNWDEFKNDITAFIEQHCQLQFNRAMEIDPSYAELWRTIMCQFEAGGKRLRPYLCALTYEAYGGNDNAMILPIAAALELIHAALLIHDDIIDRDTLRHGQPNVIGAYLSRYEHAGVHDVHHFANGAAMLAGDLLLSEAYQLVTASQLDAVVRQEVARLLGDAVFQVMAGELLDFEAAMSLPIDTQTTGISELKTASYSFAAPLLIAATVARAPKSEFVLLRQLARELGIAYQIADDIIGIFGASAKTGKSRMSDIREGKRSYLLEETLRRASPKNKRILWQIIGNPDCDEVMAAEARHIMIESGGKAAATEQMTRHVLLAENYIEQLDIAQHYKKKLTLLANLTIRRNA